MSSLVNYSDSENESGGKMVNVKEKQKKLKGKKKRKIFDVNTVSNQHSNKKMNLSLPLSIQKMFSSQNVCIESYNGKVRSFKHFEGNWPTYVFVPLTVTNSTTSLYNYLLLTLKDFGLTFFQLEDCHISLSRTVPIRHYWIEPIYSKLRGCIPQHAFNYSLISIKVYVNDEKTRTFVGVEISLGFSNFRELTLQVNKVFEEFGLETYYKDPSFHVSFAWCLGDKKIELEKHIQSCNQLKDQFSVLASKLCMKSGNKVFQIYLN